MMQNQKFTGTKCLTRTVEILNSFDFDTPMQRVSDIAAKLGVTQSTASRYLSALLDIGLLERDPDTGYYSLGVALVKYSGIFLTSSPLYRNAYHELSELHRKTKLHTHLGVQFDNRYMCIGSAGYRTPFDAFTPIGYTYPLHSTAIGKLILAHLPKKALQSALARDKLTTYQENTISDEESLQKQLHQIRQRGYSTIYNESLNNVSALAAPIYNPNRMFVGGISVSGASDVLDLASNERSLAKVVRHYADEVSRKLGYQPIK